MMATRVKIDIGVSGAGERMLAPEAQLLGSAGSHLTVTAPRSGIAGGAGRGTTRLEYVAAPFFTQSPNYLQLELQGAPFNDAALPCGTTRFLFVQTLHRGGV